MNQEKKHYKVCMVHITPCEDLWDKPGNTGKFVLKGCHVMEDVLGLYTYMKATVRTSLLVNIDLAAGTVETLNSIYHIVPVPPRVIDNEEAVYLPLEDGGFIRRHISLLNDAERFYVEETKFLSHLIPGDSDKAKQAAQKLWESMK